MAITPKPMTIAPRFPFGGMFRRSITASTMMSRRAVPVISLITGPQ